MFYLLSIQKPDEKTNKEEKQSFGRIKWSAHSSVHKQNVSYMYMYLHTSYIIKWIKSFLFATW